MILTPDQARKKQCRIFGPILMAAKVVGGTPQTGFAYCGASDCFHWRWIDEDQTQGYCGLAGVPTAQIHLAS
jgi:hypothetical protein